MTKLQIYFFLMGHFVFNLEGAVHQLYTIVCVGTAAGIGVVAC